MFQNEPLTDFTIAANRDQFRAALQAVEDRILGGGFRTGPIIEGKESFTGRSIASLDPSRSATTVGTVFLASAAEADRAIEVLRQGQAGWAGLPAKSRADIIRRAGALMRERRLALAALMTREGGKPWKESDGDVAEAIDFCFYYADEAERIAHPFRTQEVMGEENTLYHLPRGTAAVISPWNFPLAIACGMVVAGLVTGNTVVLKPAEQTSLIAGELARILLEAGVPPTAFALLPGLGEEVGRRLVAHPHVDMICFTGSKSVGLEILATAAKVQDGQVNLKRVIAELSGKNAIIVDEDADLDEAIKGVLYSAFGYAGQKCSACSRAIIVGDAYDPFMRRLTAAAADLIIGEAKDPATLIGPVIDEESQRRITGIITRIEQDTPLAFRGAVPTGGYFVPPTIFKDVQSTSLAWREEIFGPVLGCRQAKSFGEAIELANDSSFALTGGLFSRSPAHIQQAIARVECGNFYINRGCTGALVGRQPFGGFKMSGVGAQAGGPDYLLQFVHSRVVSENTMRRGFAPPSPGESKSAR